MKIRMTEAVAHIAAEQGLVLLSWCDSAKWAGGQNGVAKSLFNCS